MNFAYGGGEDLLLVWFSICINHRSIGAKMGATILLNMAQFLAEMANNGFRFYRYFRFR